MVKKDVSKNKVWLYLSIFSILLIFLVKWDSFLMLVAKFVVNNFSSGRSDFKVTSFLVYFAVSSLSIYYFSVNSKLSRILNKKNLSLFLIIFATLLFIVNTASYVYTTEQYDLNYNHYYEFVYGGQISSSQISHIHNFKAAFSKVVGFLNPGLHRDYDAGLFFLANNPSFFWIVGLISLPILIILSLATLLRLKCVIKNNKHQSLYLFMFIISSFSVLKNIYDGGFFAPELLVSFSILIGTLFYHNAFQRYLKATASLLGISFLFLSIFYGFLINSFTFAWLDFLLHLVFYLFIVLVYYFIKKKDFLYTLIVIVSYLIFVVLILINTNSYYSYTSGLAPDLFLEVPEGSSAYVFLTNTEPFCQDYIYAQDDFMVCHFKTSETTLKELFENYGVVPFNLNPVMVENTTCYIDQSYSESNEFILVEGVVPKEIITPLLNVSFSKNNTLSGKYEHYTYSITAKGCIPNYVSVVQRTFNNAGIKSYVLI